VSTEHDSRQQNEEKLRQLRREENQLISDISQNDGTMKEKIIKLAHTMELRLDLGDEMCHYLVHEISTEIARVLRSLECPIANWVRDYLPDKYKNPNLIRYQKLETVLNKITSGAVEPRKPIEECSNVDLDTTYEQKLKIKNDLDVAIKLLNQDLDLCEKIAEDRGIELQGQKFRKPISVHDPKLSYKHMIPANVQEYNKKILNKWRKEVEPAIKDIGDIYEEFPSAFWEDCERFERGIDAFIQLIKSDHDLKSTGDLKHWIKRIYLSLQQSKHSAGNSDKFPTILCAYCSDNVENDPEDFHAMFFDKDSPTELRCLKCNGTQPMMRGLSREQIGDKQIEILQRCDFIAQHLPGYYDFIHYCNQKYVMKEENSRKTIIAPQFSDSAFATSKRVVK
jgi:hypothetical protein